MPSYQGVPVDVCTLRTVPSVFLQQAAYITQGCYIAVPKPPLLLNVLLVRFASPREPTPADVGDVCGGLPRRGGS